MNAHTETAIARSVIATPYVRQALARQGMVAAILTARVIILAQAVWTATRAEEYAGGGYSEEDYRDAQEVRIGAEEDYHHILRLAEAYA